MKQQLVLVPETVLDRFDRTFEELKPDFGRSDVRCDPAGFDRTFEELKPIRRMLSVPSMLCFDRTFEELKPAQGISGFNLWSGWF